MYYRETSICILRIILCYCDILIFYISVILYLFAEGYKCRLTTFSTRFAHVISILRYCHCFASLKVLCHEQMNKYHITLLLLDVRAQIQLRSEYLFLHLLMLTPLCTRLTTIVQLRYVAIVLSVQSQNFNGLNRCDMCVEKKT